MAVVRLLGQGIAYSASPQMQAAAFAALGLPHRYELCDVGPVSLRGAVSALRDDGCLGANVTVPHKAAVLPLLDDVDDTAAKAGAVNTIVNRDGRLFGSNTDVPAIADEVVRLCGVPERTVILGAGGAARGTRLALDSLADGEVLLVSRDGRDGTAAWSQLDRLIASANLLVNATPVGTGGAESPVPAALLHDRLAVLDLVYRPSPTPLVEQARARGLAARAGAGVLLGQGRRSLETWLGVPVGQQARTAMAAALQDSLGAAADV